MTGLSPEHSAELAASLVSGELAAARGYRTVGPDYREKLRELGAPGWAIRDESAFPGLVLPMYHPRTGEFTTFQFKPAVPQPKPGSEKLRKYASPAGAGNRLDCNPAVRDRVADPRAPLWITEGVKKSDSLASLGLAAVTLTGVWNWRNREGTLGDWEDIPLKDRTVVVCFDSDAAANAQVRNAMVRFVGWLRSRGAVAKYLCVPSSVGDVAVKGVDDFLAAGGTLQELHAVSSDRAPEAPSSRDAAFSDAYLTEAVCAASLSGSFLYARGLGWMRYTGCVWTETDESTVVEEVRRWAKAQWEDVVEEYKRDQSRDVQTRMTGWRQILTSNRLKALASLSRGVMHVDATQFDAHPDLLNCPNGIVDLRTGELLEHGPEYLFTKVTGCDYEPGADHPDFRAALDALPDDVQGWYRARIGQAFTGHMTSDDLMIVQQGGGENGKSTLAVPISRAAGSYQLLVSDRVILGNHDQHPTEFMDLKGVRYALLEETPEARQLNVQQLKRVVGTPQITARRIRQDSVTFDATHSLFVNTNYLPSVTESDRATWRRLALLKFPYTFRGNPEDVTGPYDRLGDAGLRERCKSDPAVHRAALAWAVEGAREWYERGMTFERQPERVVTDTLAWRRDGDLLMAFAEDRLDFTDPEAEVKTMDVFAEFLSWLLPTGHKAWAQKVFKARFDGHDLIAAHRVGTRRDRALGMLFTGVRIKKNDPVAGAESGNNPFAPNPK